MPQKTKIRFVNIGKYGFIIDPRYYFYGWANTVAILGRKSAVENLLQAKKLLPKGYNFKVWDCKRSYKIQELMMKSFKKRLDLLHPKLTANEKKKLLLKFSGGLVKKVERLDTHRNGGAFDLTIVDNIGNELYMGTDFDDLTEKAATDYYENKPNLDVLEKEARENRRLLRNIMKKAGFVNYPIEWWHWSYDK